MQDFFKEDVYTKNIMPWKITLGKVLLYVVYLSYIALTHKDKMAWISPSFFPWGYNWAITIAIFWQVHFTIVPKK